VERHHALAHECGIGRALSDVDCIYVAASAHDARFARICVASIRYFYPDLPIRLLAGGDLQSGLIEELRSAWNVQQAAVPHGDYGWGFVKLEPLFLSPGHRFVVLDADTVITGPILDLMKDSDASFIVDDETQSQEDTVRLYYNWNGLRAIDREARSPLFVFNSGQWLGSAGILTRDDFSPWIRWDMPRSLRYPEHFMGGEQGVLNYVLNQKHASSGLRVERRRLLRWPGHGMDGLSAERVIDRTAPALVVHWAGMKRNRLQDMVGADLLQFFESYHYQRVYAGSIRRLVALCRHFVTQWRRAIGVHIVLSYRRMVRDPLLKLRRVL